MRCIAMLAAASLCTLALSGCGTTAAITIANTNATIQQKLADACPKVEQAHTAFVLVTWIVKVPQALVTAEAAAYATAEKYCAAPATVTVQNAPQLVLDAIDDINAAKAKTGAAD